MARPTLSGPISTCMVIPFPDHVVAVTGPVRNDEFDRRKQCILFSLLDLRELNDLTQVQITFRLRPSVATARLRRSVPESDEASIDGG